MKKRLGLLDYKDWALDAIVGKKDFLNLSVRHLKSEYAAGGEDYEK